MSQTVQILQHALMILGAVTAVCAVVAIWGAMLFAALHDAAMAFYQWSYDRESNKFFNQIEEYHRDFRS